MRSSKCGFSILPSHKVAFSATLSRIWPSSSLQTEAAKSFPDGPSESLAWACPQTAHRQGCHPLRKKNKTLAQPALLCSLQEDNATASATVKCWVKYHPGDGRMTPKLIHQSRPLLVPTASSIQIIDKRAVPLSLGPKRAWRAVGGEKPHHPPLLSPVGSSGRFESINKSIHATTLPNRGTR